MGQKDAAGAWLDDWNIVIVGHNSSLDIEECWADAPQHLRSRVIFVDNESTDDTAALAATLFPVVVASANLGLSHGNNEGLRRCTEKYVLFCNPDVRPQLPDFERLAQHLERHGGIVSPRLKDRAGTLQDNARGWPSLLTQIMNRMTHPARQTDYRWPVSATEDATVPWVLGAAIAMRVDQCQTLGGWPDEYFLYFEDTELCLRAWKNEMPVWILGSIVWHHNWARSSRGYFSRAARLHGRAALRFYSLHPELIFSTATSSA